MDQTTNVIFEIIIVDNNSTKDNSVEILSNIPNIVFIKSNYNLGFGNANNLGFKHSKGKYIFLLNSDTVLLNNAVKIFFDRMEKSSKNIACLGAILKDEDLNIVHSYGSFPSIKSCLKSSYLLYLHYLTNKKNNQPELTIPENDFEVDYIMGADIFIKRETIRKFNLFDPDFFMYYEETEMQFRFKKNGLRSIIIHGLMEQIV